MNDELLDITEEIPISHRLQKIEITLKKISDTLERIAERMR